MKDRIRELMEAQHMNQQTFSHYTGIGTATLSSIFTGRTRPTLNTIESIMKKFPEVNVNWLMFGQGEMMTSSADGKNMDPSSPTPKQDIFDMQPNTSSASPQVLNFNDAQNEIVNTTYQQPSTNPSRRDNEGYNESFQNYSPTTPRSSSAQQNLEQNNIVQSHTQQSANMAVRPNYKESSHQQNYAERQRAAFPQIEDNSTEVIPHINVSSQQKRKVTEIRVFYDDQTWEAFVPKNKGGF